MSTFRGVMAEFPDVRVDFFRTIPGCNVPLACFLSHVHSDHLAGLESLRSPFIYCSAATKEMLVRIEKKFHRTNYERGVLEARKQHYKHLKSLLKPIPLETPTQIELRPGNEIQVTLFDANHCTGAVMFLFEGDGKAVLYTGDIRSEPWFVNSLTRNPFLIEYTAGLKTLECIYLDTSNIKPIHFPSKADGLKELVQKVSNYPKDTIFHFAAWTYGYEQAWMTLSRVLNSPIHVSKYSLRIYSSLRGETSESPSGPFIAHEGPVLTGYKCGNTPQMGCLTNDETVRIHSCEKALGCPSIDQKTVWIKPIVTRLGGGVDIGEIDVGGGGGDLIESAELEFEGDFELYQLQDSARSVGASETVINEIKRMFRTGRGAIFLDGMGFDYHAEEITISDLVKAIDQKLAERRNPTLNDLEAKMQDEPFPRVITFPYSRHSSYHELCDLVRAFKPRDIYPCTVDEENWHEGVSMRKLFGHECSSTNFRHDIEMRELRADKEIQLISQQSQTTTNSQSSPIQELDFLELQTLAVQPNEATYTIRRNSEGLLRRSDSSGVEQPFTSVGKVHQNGVEGIVRTYNRAASVPTASKENVNVTPPPFEVYAASPSSASQGFRRKAIFDGLIEPPPKRPRIQHDGPHSSPSESPARGLTTTIRGSNVKMEFGILTRSARVEESATLAGEPSKVAVLKAAEESNKAICLPILSEGCEESSVQRGGSSAKPQTTAGDPTPMEIIEISNDSEQSEGRSEANIPGSEADIDSSQRKLHPERPSFLIFRNRARNEIGPREHELFRDRRVDWDNLDEDGVDYDYDYMHEDTFFDAENSVTRCKLCNHEVWYKLEGFCTGCEEGQSGVPYFEVLDPEAGYEPTFEVNEDARQEDLELNDMLGPYLDCHSSAYDSQDEGLNFNEEYEANSFIDDEEHESNDEEDRAPSSDGETDYKEKFKSLQAAYGHLQAEYDNIEEVFDDFKRDVLESGYESESDMNKMNSMGDRNEAGVVPVDVAVHDPVVTNIILSEVFETFQNTELPDGKMREAVGGKSDSTTDLAIPQTDDQQLSLELSEEVYRSTVEAFEAAISEHSSDWLSKSPTELVISQARGQSQESEISEGRIKSRVEAFEAASSENGSGWHNISLLSAGNNHTFPEVEL